MTICFRLLQPAVPAVPSDCFAQSLVEIDLRPPSGGGGHGAVPARPSPRWQHFPHLARRQHGDVAGRATGAPRSGAATPTGPARGYRQPQRPDARDGGRRCRSSRPIHSRRSPVIQLLHAPEGPGGVEKARRSPPRGRRHAAARGARPAPAAAWPAPAAARGRTPASRGRRGHRRPAAAGSTTAVRRRSRVSSASPASLLAA